MAVATAKSAAPETVSGVFPAFATRRTSSQPATKPKAYASPYQRSPGSGKPSGKRNRNGDRS